MYGKLNLTTWRHSSYTDAVGYQSGVTKKSDTIMKIRDLIKRLEDDGWFQVRMRGSHQQFHHPTKNGTVTLAGHPSTEVPPGILKSVMKQAELE